jgi:hypothetical protein
LIQAHASGTERFGDVSPAREDRHGATFASIWKSGVGTLAHDHNQCCGLLQGALMAAIACQVLSGCSLITGFDAKRDAAAGEPDIEEHDAAVTTPDDGDPAVDEDQSLADAAVKPAIPDAGVDPLPDAGVTPEAGPGPGEPSEGGAPDSSVPSSSADAAAPRPSTGDLIDAVGGERDDRTDKICSCPGAGQECVRAGFGKSSCLERGITALSGTSEESVRALLECMLPAERAYTECVKTRLSCRSVEASTSACGLAYELATARCNVSSIQGLSLQGLCSR